MPEKTRIRGVDVSILTIGTLDPLALYEECSVDIDTPMVEVTTARDTDGRHQRPAHTDSFHNWTLTARKLIDAASIFGDLLIRGIGSPRTKLVTVTFKEISTGKQYSGEAWAVRGGHRSGRAAAQNEEITLEGEGTLTWA